MLNYDKNLKSLARELRKNMTEAEQLLWSRLRRGQLRGIQFYRQKPIGSFIVDFYAPAVRLVIEIDGSQHYDPSHQQKDLLRDQYLAKKGLVVMRFDNLQVLNETEAVLEKILEYVAEMVKKSPPTPLFQRGEYLK